MGRRKRAALTSIDNLKKSKDENSTKRQKCDHPQPRPGKENESVSFLMGNQDKFLLNYDRVHLYMLKGLREMKRHV